MIDPKDFKELVTWSVWRVIEGITQGRPLESVMTGVLDYAMRWRSEQAAKAGKGGADHG